MERHPYCFHLNKVHVLSFSPIFPDLLRLTTILLPYCKGQEDASGKTHFSIASLLLDISSSCPLFFMESYLSCFSPFIHISHGSVFCHFSPEQPRFASQNSHASRFRTNLQSFLCSNPKRFFSVARCLGSNFSRFIFSMPTPQPKARWWRLPPRHFLIKLTLMGIKLQQAKGQEGFPSLKTKKKKLTLKWSVDKWKDKTAKSSP